MSTNSKTFFNTTVLNSQHKDIKRLKKDYPTSIHGNKIWKSSYLLMDYFTDNPIDKNLKVLELGCGWGPTGIFLNTHFDAKVTAVDADGDVFPYIELHCDINNAEVEFWETKFEDISASELAEYDIIVAADVCFWDELAQIHQALIGTAIKAGVKKIVYADPERQPFLDLALYCEEHFFADNYEVSLPEPINARGAIMVIENE